MNLILPREFLWQDYKTMDEFMKEPINHELYKVYQQVKDAPFKISMPDIKVFNELYYQAVKFCYCNVTIESIANSVIADLGFVYSKDLIISMLFPIICLQKKRIDEVYMIMEYLGSNRGWYLDPFNDLVNNSKNTYNTDLSPKPIDVVSAINMVSNWPELTNYFSRSAILKIVNLWKNKEEQVLIIESIKIAYDEFVKEGKSILPQQGYYYDNDTVDDIELERIIHKIKKNVKIPTSGKEYSTKKLKNQLLGKVKQNRDELLLSDNEGELPAFAQVVSVREKAVDIINLLHKRMKGKKKPLDVVMPIRAAMDARVIRRPTWKEIKVEFPEVNCAKSSYERITNQQIKPFEGNKTFDKLVEEFKDL